MRQNNFNEFPVMRERQIHQIQHKSWSRQTQRLIQIIKGIALAIFKTRWSFIFIRSDGMYLHRNPIRYSIGNVSTY